MVKYGSVRFYWFGALGWFSVPCGRVFFIPLTVLDNFDSWFVRWLSKRGNSFIW